MFRTTIPPIPCTENSKSWSWKFFGGLGRIFSLDNRRESLRIPLWARCTSVAEIAWSEKPIASVQVELLKLNKIEFEIDGPNFGSIEVTIRGTRA